MRSSNISNPKSNWKQLALPGVVCGVSTGLLSAWYVMSFGLPAPPPSPYVTLPSTKATALSSWLQFNRQPYGDYVLEFGDYQCPFCRSASFTIGIIKKLYQKDASFLFVQYPLSEHPLAKFAALAELSASQRGKGDEMADWLMNAKDIRPPSIIAHAKYLGISSIELSLEAKSKAVLTQLQSDRSLGDKVGVNAVPYFIFVGSDKSAYQFSSVDALSDFLRKRYR